MFRLWGKLYKDTRIIRNTVISIDDRALSLTTKTDTALNDICMLFDLQKPMWLSDNKKDYKQFSRTIFTAEHFIEQIEFDHLEIEIIENDDTQ